MPSQRYLELAKRVTELRSHLLPSRFDETGSYHSPGRVNTRTLSFQVLAHGEIEAFLEDRAWELFNAGWSHWQSRSAPSRVLLALMAFSGTTTMAPPSTLDLRNEQKAYKDISVPVHRAQEAWRNRYKDNHGVKEKHVLGLFLPLGIHPDRLDTTLLADLNSFGGLRGEAAHRSSGRVTKQLDPRSEYDRVLKLIEALKAIDAAVQDALDEFPSDKSPGGQQAARGRQMS